MTVSERNFHALFSSAPALSHIGQEPSEDQIDAAARELWNDRDARMGGSWDSHDPQEVCVIQTKATARAMLKAARKVG